MRQTGLFRMVKAAALYHVPIKSYSRNTHAPSFLKRAVEHSSTAFIVPFVLIDSLNDMSFPLLHIRYHLLRVLTYLLLMDLQNLSGFARLK